MTAPARASTPRSFAKSGSFPRGTGLLSREDAECLLRGARSSRARSMVLPREARSSCAESCTTPRESRARAVQDPGASGACLRSRLAWTTATPGETGPASGGPRALDAWTLSPTGDRASRASELGGRATRPWSSRAGRVAYPRSLALRAGAAGSFRGRMRGALRSSPRLAASRLGAARRGGRITARRPTDGSTRTGSPALTRCSRGYTLRAIFTGVVMSTLVQVATFAVLAMAAAGCSARATVEARRGPRPRALRRRRSLPGVPRRRARPPRHPRGHHSGHRGTPGASASWSAAARSVFRPSAPSIPRRGLSPSPGRRAMTSSRRASGRSRSAPPSRPGGKAWRTPGRQQGRLRLCEGAQSATREHQSVEQAPQGPGRGHRHHL